MPMLSGMLRGLLRARRSLPQHARSSSSGGGGSAAAAAAAAAEGARVRVQGWVRSVRRHKQAVFLDLAHAPAGPGAGPAAACRPSQLVLPPRLAPDAGAGDGTHAAAAAAAAGGGKAGGDGGDMQRLDTGCAVQAEGVLVARPGRGGASTGEGAREELELHVDSWRIVGGVGTTAAGEPYPLAKKRHSLEHLRSFLHLRPRTKSLGATMRVRSALAHAVHDFFRQREFELVHTPVITASDCEGAGELFQVEAVDGDDHGDQAAPERPHHFFGEPTFLTVSGQMSAEAYACAMGNVYTFGPAFRAERSHTVRHLAEFYMIEPEMAFAGLSDVVANARDLLVHCVRTALRDHGEHIEFLQQQYHRWEEEQQQRQGKKASNSKKKRHLHQLTKSSPQQNMEFLERIQSSSNSRSNVFVTMTYAEAVGMLQGAIAKDRSKWQFPDLLVGDALQTEHEQWLARECGHAVVFVTDYPAGIKPFYMRGNDDDARSVVPTVACMDMLVPRIGELAGGSAREERLNVLQQQMQSHGLDPNSPAYEWYLDLRRFGTVPHAGYGMGFERLVCLVTGARNIRDVIPFPRFENHAVG